MAATPPNANASPSRPAATPAALRGVLLDRVRRTWAEVSTMSAADAASLEPFLVAVGALAVYARACGVPVVEVVGTVHAVLAGDEANRRDALVASVPAWWELVRETAIRNYDRVD